MSYDDKLSSHSSHGLKYIKSGPKPGIASGPTSRKSASYSSAQLCPIELLQQSSKVKRSFEDEYKGFLATEKYMKSESMSAVTISKTKDDGKLYKSKSCEYVKNDAQKLSMKSLSQRSGDKDYLAGNNSQVSIVAQKIAGGALSPSFMKQLHAEEFARNSSAPDLPKDSPVSVVSPG